MTIIYYECIDEEAYKSYFELKLVGLPGAMIDRIRKFRRWQDAMAALYGKLLLLAGLKKFGIEVTLEELKYNAYNKPYIDSSPVSFNISHAGKYVICAISNDVDNLGVDIEEIKAIDLNDFQSIWTKDEWKLLSTQDMTLFYQFWTRKEAIIKADGRGMSIPLQMIDVKDSIVELFDEKYYLQSLHLDSNYALHLACPKPVETVELIHLSV